MCTRPATFSPRSPASSLLTINPASLTVTADAQSKFYGQTLAFGAGSVLFTSVGLQNDEAIGTVTLAVSNGGGLATAPVVGTYAITPSAAIGGTFDASDYDITYDTAALTVNTAVLTITASPESKTYGQTLAFGAGSVLFTSVGLQNDEAIGTVTLAVSNGGGLATAPVVGTYAITPSAATGGTFVASDYDITYDTGTDDQPGGADGHGRSAVEDLRANLRLRLRHALFTSVGLQNEETIGTVTLAVSNNGGLAAAPVVGTYAITPSLATGGTFVASDYDITYDTVHSRSTRRR